MSFNSKTILLGRAPAHTRHARNHRRFLVDQRQPEGVGVSLACSKWKGPPWDRRRSPSARVRRCRVRLRFRSRISSWHLRAPAGRCANGSAILKPRCRSIGHKHFEADHPHGAAGVDHQAIFAARKDDAAHQSSHWPITAICVPPSVDHQLVGNPLRVELVALPRTVSRYKGFEGSSSTFSCSLPDGHSTRSVSPAIV